MTYTIVGVIGHIDHGKTSLVAALTGVDTDSHPEEKQRGITIDLGFASFDHGEHTFAMVDAPGHQKYIGNLLAGVASVDVGLLVVAADQGIQAQTLEHAAILQSLAVKTLIVVISRIDLADKATQNVLEEELDLFLADFGFLDIPKVAVSTVEGTGLDQLRELLIEHARTEQRDASTYFRMPIDRAFTIEGRGTVIAGTPWSGKVAVGQHLQVAQTGDRVRIREIEIHGDPVGASSIGMRTAMNVVGNSAEINRGDELVEEGTYSPATKFVAELKMFGDAIEVKFPITVQLHTATNAVQARISGPRCLAGGESAVVVLDSTEPIVASFRQPLLFRRPYPVGSFAGGKIVATIHPNHQATLRTGQNNKLIRFGEKLAEADHVGRLKAWVELLGEWEIDRQHMELQMGIRPERQTETVAAAVQSGDIQQPTEQRLVSSERIASIGNYLEKIMKQRAEIDDQAWLDSAALAQRAAHIGSEEFVGWVISDLVKEKRLVRFNKMVAIASQETVLSKKQRARMDQILTMFSGTRTPPSLKEIAAELQTTMEAVTSLTRFATQQGVLVDLGNGLLIDQRVFVEICQDLDSLFNQQAQRTVAEIRDFLKITRKYAIPLLEYCDAQNITVRNGDTRTAGLELAKLLKEYSGEHQ